MSNTMEEADWCERNKIAYKHLFLNIPVLKTNPEIVRNAVMGWDDNSCLSQVDSDEDSEKKKKEKRVWRIIGTLIKI